ncbi:hypothetical protein [Clostridium sp. UBA7503]|uniref:hypothetical protein n=1 Tax=Clostridium sp. UBA7503 TaxID=1946377 RepID=UPI00321780AE
MKKEYEGQGIISLMISAIICLIVGILNIKSDHYVYGISILIAFILVLVEVFRKIKNRHIIK